MPHVSFRDIQCIIAIRSNDNDINNDQKHDKDDRFLSRLREFVDYDIEKYIKWQTSQMYINKYYHNYERMNAKIFSKASGAARK